MPAIDDPDGRPVGATFLRNNLNKRSVTLNLKDPEGVRLCLELAKTADIVCENFKAGTADRLGIGYDAVKAVNPQRSTLGLRLRERPCVAAHPPGCLCSGGRGHVGHL